MDNGLPWSPALVDLLVSAPVVAAPMAGGPSTPDLVAAAAAAGSVRIPGRLDICHREALARPDCDHAPASTDRFGVNLFVPNPVPVDPVAFRAYANALAAMRRPVRARPRRCRDHRGRRRLAGRRSTCSSPIRYRWSASRSASRTAGIVRALRRAGSRDGADGDQRDGGCRSGRGRRRRLVVQASAAGGHWERSRRIGRRSSSVAGAGACGARRGDAPRPCGRRTGPAGGRQGRPWRRR